MMKTNESQKPILTPPLRLFLAGEIFIRLAEMYSLFMPLYLLQLGASVADIGLAYSLAGILPFGLNILGGWFSDRFGRLRVITWGNVVKVLAFGVMLAGGRWEWIGLGISLVGASAAIAGPGYSAFIADHTREEDRATVYSIQLNIKNLISLIMFPLAGLIGAEFGFRWMLLIAGGVHLIGTILIGSINMILKSRLTAVSNLIQENKKWLSLGKSLSILIGLIAAGGLFTWVFIIDHLNDIFLGMSQSLQPVYSREVIGISLQQIGYLPAIGALIGLIITIPLGKWVDRRGEHIGLGLAYIFLALFLAVPLVARNFLMLLPTAFLHPIMHGLAGPAYRSLVSKLIPEEQRGIAFGLTATSRGLISIPAPYLGGLLWEKVSPRAPFLFAIAGSIGLSILAFLKLRFPESNHQQPAD
jgi:MFS family permease